MPIIFLELKDYTPDSGSWLNEGLSDIRMLSPHQGYYEMIPNLHVQNTNSVSETTYGKPLGMHIINSSDGSWQMYVGTDTGKLLRTMNSLGNGTFMDPFEDLSPAGLTGNSAYGWQFVSWGDQVIGTNYVDRPQKFVSSTATNPYGTTTNFSDLATTSPGYDVRAAFITTVRNHVLLGRLNSPASGSYPTAISSDLYDHTVWWSGTDNATKFGSEIDTPTIIGTSYQPLIDNYGGITGLVGGDYALVFKRKAIYRMDGPPFQFTLMCAGIGTEYPNSIVKFGSDVYFWGPQGPMVIDGGSSMPRPLAEGKLQKTLTTTGNGICPWYGSIEKYMISATASYIANKIYWTYYNEAAVAMILEYDLQSRRFGLGYAIPVDANGGADSDFLTPRFMKNIGHIPSDGWLPGRDLWSIIRYGSTSKVFYVGRYSNEAKFIGNKPCTFTFSFNKFCESSASKTSRITRFRIVGEWPSTSTAVAMTVSGSVYSAYAQGGSFLTTTVPDTNVTPDGWVTVPNCPEAMYHSIAIGFDPGDSTTTIKKIIGLEVEYAVGAARAI